MLLTNFTGTITDGGVPLQGSVRVLAGSNLAAIFADPELTVPLFNPVPLNSLGQAPAMYVHPGTYTVQVLRDGSVFYEATAAPAVEARVFQGQQLNSRGMPNAGGLIYTYLTGSFSIKVDTFSDETRSTLNENPTQLDNMGFLQTRFFTVPGQKVNFVLTDEVGAVLSAVEFVAP